MPLKCYNRRQQSTGAVSLTRPFRFSHGLSPPEEFFETSQFSRGTRRTIRLYPGSLGRQETGGKKQRQTGRHQTENFWQKNQQAEWQEYAAEIQGPGCTYG
jgi:hypothetical protein